MGIVIILVIIATYLISVWSFKAELSEKHSKVTTLVLAHLLAGLMAVCVYVLYYFACQIYLQYQVHRIITLGVELYR